MKKEKERVREIRTAEEPTFQVVERGERNCIDATVVPIDHSLPVFEGWRCFSPKLVHLCGEKLYA